MGCTCKKTKCLKLYCQCFAVKIYCAGNCRCLICRNTAKFEKERKDAIRNILSRNPSAFDTKFKKTLDGRPAPDRPVVDTSRVLAHKLGCKCRKSACMKKYCECYAGNVKCSANCRCVGCKNMPPGGLGPTSGPTGGAILNQTASVGSSEGDAHHAISKPGKRREPWMMNAAQNLVRASSKFAILLELSLLPVGLDSHALISINPIYVGVFEAFVACGKTK